MFTYYGILHHINDDISGQGSHYPVSGECVIPDKYSSAFDHEVATDA